MPDLVDCRILLGGHDLSGLGNRVNISHVAPMVDQTGSSKSGMRRMMTRPAMTHVDGDIFCEDDAPGYRCIHDVLTLIPANSTAGDRAYLVSKVDGLAHPRRDATVPTLDLSLESRTGQFIRGRLIWRGLRFSSGSAHPPFQVNTITEQHRLVSVCQLLTPPSRTIRVSLEQWINGRYTPCLTHVFSQQGKVKASWMEIQGPLVGSMYRASWDTEEEFEACHVVGVY